MHYNGPGELLIQHIRSLIKTQNKHKAPLPHRNKLLS